MKDTETDGADSRDEKRTAYSLLSRDGKEEKLRQIKRLKLFVDEVWHREAKMGVKPRDKSPTMS